MRLLFAKHPGGLLMPVSREARVFVGSLKKDEGAGLNVKVVNNIQFHKKLIALLELAFHHWEPNVDFRIDGVSVRQDFIQFRKKVMVLAGHYREWYDAEGNVTLDPLSISFAECDELERIRLYKAVMEVVWARILQPIGYPSKEHAEVTAAMFMDFEFGGGGAW